MSFHLETIPNRKSRPTVLIRKAWREDGRLRKKTLANLTQLPPHIVDGIRGLFEGGVAIARPEDVFTIRRSLPHGHVAAVLGTLRSLGLVRVLGRKAGRMRDLAVAAVVARVVDPASKLATARALDPETASTSLGAVLGLGPVTGNDMLDMLDWLLERQPWIERSLANRHLKGGNTLILYDVSSSYLEGRKCPLAAFGHNRDGKRGRMQVTCGLLCAADGCPVAVEVFAGNAGDPSTVASQVDKVRSRFGIGRMALVGDRGMLTTARIREDLEPAGLDWISALKTGDIRKLLRAGADGAPAPLEPEALVPDAVAEVTGPDFPGERLMVCLNPRLRQERARKREELLKATEEALEAIAASVRAGRLKGREAIDRRVGRDANRRKVGKHFEIDVTDGGISWRRREARIAAEARLDGVYVIRTSLDSASLGPAAAVEAYKGLARVERAFLTMKASRLRIRPVHVWSEDHVRAHVFLCMLAYHVEWHMRRDLAPILFEDDDREGARAQRNSPVEPARVSESARAKAADKRTPDGLPVHGFTTLLADLATLTLNEVTLPGSPDHAFPLLATPTELQRRAFELLEIDPARDVAM
ncbi:MAG: IS1634 family transposase [Acidimicrobiaceae bacterium]|nr:IS1634 family transposase [Acidimicrobiaceae bacterium]